MQCERCNKKKATVFYRENMSGRIRALRLCGDCAELLEQVGELEEISISCGGELSPVLLSDDPPLPLPFSPASSPSPHGLHRKCPLCGAVYSELAATGRMGCGRCYETFAEELSETLKALHGKAEHSGRVSAGYRAMRERQRRLEELRREMREAVAAEEFERAAGLRDEIRGLEAVSRSL